MKNKRGIQVKQYRKEIAELLRSGKQEYARIRVEAVIRENATLQAYEILELYMELIAVRVQLIAKNKEIPGDMVEAISSIIYAAQRVNDLPELGQLRALFATKYSKEYVNEASSDVNYAKWSVNENLRRCLTIEPPQPEEKLQTLSEIAQEYNVEWDASAAARSLLPSEGARPSHSVPQPAPTPIHGVPPAMYTNASDAAHAAAVAAQQAQAAAAYAAQFAPPRPYPPGAAPLGAASSDNLSIGPKDKEPTQPPQPIQPPPQLPPQFPLGPGPSGVGDVGQGPPQPPFNPNDNQSAIFGGPPGLAAAGFVSRTPEEIQRAYDAAAGPPVKDHNNYGQGPETASAPPPPEVPHEAPAPPPPQAPAPPRGASPQDEYDELQKRFEMLKRS